MSEYAKTSGNSHVRCRSVRERVEFLEIISIGTTGAPTIAAGNGDDPKIAITRSGTGAYALVYPKGKRVWLKVTPVSPLLTVVNAVVTATDAAAGTATFTTVAGTNAAAATDPASGDTLQIEIKVEV